MYFDDDIYFDFYCFLDALGSQKHDIYRFCMIELDTQSDQIIIRIQEVLLSIAVALASSE